MKSKRRKRKIVPYRRRFHLNIGIIIFAFVFIYFVIYLISYLTQNNIAVYEVQYGQIAKNKSYTGLVLRRNRCFMQVMQVLSIIIKKKEIRQAITI